MSVLSCEFATIVHVQHDRFSTVLRGHVAERVDTGSQRPNQCSQCFIAALGACMFKLVHRPGPAGFLAADVSFLLCLDKSGSDVIVVWGALSAE